MHYFALLLHPERTTPPSPDQQAVEMAEWERFHELAAPAIRAGDALAPAADAVRVTGGPDAPVVTEGPYAEGAEVAGGYYVFEADDLDAALAIAQDIPAARFGAVEVWPMVEWRTPARALAGDWLALLLEPVESASAPGSAEWNEGARAHEAFGRAADEHILTGAALQHHSTATTVQVRDGKAALTDGPFAEGAEVAHGFYVLAATDRDEAVKLASMIPASTVEVRRLAGDFGPVGQVSALDGVFRRHWGPAVATLARWSGDLSIAEDAVQEACAEAVDVWPRDGMPDNPGAWLVRVARNRALDRIRRESLRPGKELAAVLDDIGTERTPPPHPVRDDELRMMFTCAHPALDRVSQLALTLRLISGLSVPEIARALLQTEAAVAQRITRAKNKIRQANIPLRVPPPHTLPERTEHVLSCIYSVFTEGYWSTAGPSAIRDELCDEAVRLSAELCALLPDSRDAQALAALILLHDSRRDSRVDRDGALVPLDEQDRRAWSRGKITRGLQHLRNATGAAGPYLPQAVIAAVHATSPDWQSTDWGTICTAYDRVIDLTDSPVARANRALAIGFRDDFAAGLAALDAVADDPRLARSSTVASIRADLLRRAGRFAEAAQCYEQALAASGSAPAQAFLRRRLDL